ncbi:RNA polymerase II nuclear localization protein Iwr1p [[Candida] anglica]|uniref:RNA polymerase II nuclear localization protein Iwr1p n=1 Tax=[Candida] anglica TaxID=148631 RepID=A0ABP0E988_9ASCO
MSFNSPPTVLRIKRKRDQDPLQALILEDRNTKKSKPSSLASSVASTPVKGVPGATSAVNESLLFTLTRTDESSAVVTDETVMQSILSESRRKGQGRKFVIPKRQLEEDTVIPNELTDMLDSLLVEDGASSAAAEGGSSRPKKRRHHGSSSSRNIGSSSNIPTHVNPEPSINDQVQRDHEYSADPHSSPSTQLSEYVYDVYQLASPEAMTTANHPSSTIGYIRFFDDEENDLYQSDDDDNNKLQLSDDEDSNAEDFYQNDYPEDEDAGAFSDTYTDEEASNDDDDEADAGAEDDENADIYLVQPNATDDLVEGFDYIESQDAVDGIANEELEDLYDQFYDDDDYDDDDHVDFLEDDEFERNEFFPEDRDSELAIHRDRIFGKLQRMIDERE